MTALIFFDINGTIIERDSRTDMPYGKAIDIFLNVQNGMEDINNAARSDKDVFIEILEKYNQDFNEGKWNKFLNIYKQQLEYYRESDIWRENVDAIEFVNKLASTNHKLSLITGELSIGAKYKLEKIGLWNHFQTGGFGEDGIRRCDIAEKALMKAKGLYGENFKDLYVIGDTILDIKTARHIGAKIISITTGANSREELEREQPDYIIDTFNEIHNLFL